MRRDRGTRARSPPSSRARPGSPPVRRDRGTRSRRTSGCSPSPGRPRCPIRAGACRETPGAPTPDRARERSREREGAMIDRRERIGLVTVLAAGLLAVDPPVGGSIAGACVIKEAPVGEAFVDCSGGQVFNIVPPGQAGTYNMADFLRAQAGQGFPPHTRDQEPMYADLLDIAPNLRGADISTFYKDASF